METEALRADLTYLIRLGQRRMQRKQMVVPSRGVDVLLVSHIELGKDVHRCHVLVG